MLGSCKSVEKYVVPHTGKRDDNKRVFIYFSGNIGAVNT